MEWLLRVQTEWHNHLSKIIEDLPESKWQISNLFKAGEPAASTLIGLEYCSSKKYRGIIIGDSCFFQIRNDNLLVLEGVSKSEDFNDSPECFVSYSEYSIYEPSYFEGEIKTGDFFILGTDKFSKWILKHYEAPPATWKRCLRWMKKYCEKKLELRDLVDFARKSITGINLENDDIGLIVILV